MSVYICLFTGALILGVFLCGKKIQPWGKLVYCVLCGVAFFLISALRFSTGYDYNMYATIFTNYNYMSLSDVSLDRTEKGIAVPMYILNRYSETYLPFFTVTSLVIYAGIFLLIYKKSSVPWVSVLMFLSLGAYFNSLNFIRQFIAAVVVAFAMKYIEQKSPFKYVLVIILASVFHWSALFMLPFYLILKIKPNAITLSLYAATLTAVMVFSNQILTWVTNTFYMYGGYKPETSVHMLIGLPVKYTLMFAIPFVVCMLFRNRLAEKNPMNLCYINCLIFVVFFEVIGIKHSIISRFSLLFMLPSVLFLLPDLYVVIKEKFENIKIRICLASLGLVCTVFCYVMLLSGNYNGVVPYKSIVNMEKHELYYNENEDKEGADDDGE